jgi:hypothetical protein
MLRNFAIALVATTLLAGPALAAQSSGTAGATSATPKAPVMQTAPATNARQPAKQAVKQTHVRQHLAHGKNSPMHQAHHVKPAKTHQANVSAAAKRS